MHADLIFWLCLVWHSIYTQSVIVRSAPIHPIHSFSDLLRFCATRRTRMPAVRLVPMHQHQSTTTNHGRPLPTPACHSFQRGMRAAPTSIPHAAAQMLAAPTHVMHAGATHHASIAPLTARVITTRSFCSLIYIWTGVQLYIYMADTSACSCIGSSHLAKSMEFHISKQSGYSVPGTLWLPTGNGGKTESKVASAHRAGA